MGFFDRFKKEDQPAGFTDGPYECAVLTRDFLSVVASSVFEAIQDIGLSFTSSDPEVSTGSTLTVVSRVLNTGETLSIQALYEPALDQTFALFFLEVTPQPVNSDALQSAFHTGLLTAAKRGAIQL